MNLRKTSALSSLSTETTRMAMVFTDARASGNPIIFANSCKSGPGCGLAQESGSTSSADGRLPRARTYLSDGASALWPSMKTGRSGSAAEAQWS